MNWKDDITHDQKIVVALAETIRLMQETDAVIERHGGWPRAIPHVPVETAPECGLESEPLYFCQTP